MLGALLDAVSAALRNAGRVELAERPRMADFAEWVVAAEGALGWEPGAFMDAYAGNRGAATGTALDEDPVATAVRELVAERGEWSGTATELLSELGGMVDEATRRSRSWPAAPSALSSALKRLAPALREVGIESGGRKVGREKKRIKTLRGRPKGAVRTARIVRDGAADGANGAPDGGRPADAAGGGEVATDGTGPEGRPQETAARTHACSGAVGADDLLHPFSVGSADGARQEDPGGGA